MTNDSPTSRRGRPTGSAGLGLAAAMLALCVFAGGAPGQEVGSGGDTPAEWVEGIRPGLPNYVRGEHPDRPRIMYRDSLVSLNDYCPVRKARLDPDRKPVYVNGTPIGFCCSPCPVTFSADPEKYLRDLHASFPCPVHPRRRAIFDSSLRARVNQDIFFFSSVQAKSRFLKDPLRYTKTLTDPVSFQRFHPKKASPHVVFRGRDYYFAADSTLARFQAEPEKWFERKTSH
jgi:YHS domain-containing protein